MQFEIEGEPLSTYGQDELLEEEEEFDREEDESVGYPTEEELAQFIQQVFDSVQRDPIEPNIEAPYSLNGTIAWVDDYSGLMTTDKGVVLRLLNGAEYQIDVKLSKLPGRGW